MLYQISRQKIYDYQAVKSRLIGRNSLLRKSDLETPFSVEKEGCRIIKNDLQNKIIQAYDSKDKSFDGTKLQKLLFPQIDSSSVFISHSFGDQEIAIKLKEIIERELGFEAFVDSLYWDSMYSVQEKLQERYEPNSVSKHLHAMLNSAITLMIAQCKYFIFIKSDNSLSKENSTESPWIYHELQIADLLHKPKPLVEARRRIMESDLREMRCFYDVESIIKNMEPTTIEKILLWQ